MTDFIPAEHVQIVWNEEKGVIKEIALIDARDQKAVKRGSEKYDCWAGHQTMGWPTDEGQTPLDIFTRLAFSKPQPLGIEIIAVFARIKECDWARTMLAELKRMRERGWVDFNLPDDPE